MPSPFKEQIGKNSKNLNMKKLRYKFEDISQKVQNHKEVQNKIEKIRKMQGIVRLTFKQQEFQRKEKSGGTEGNTSRTQGPTFPKGKSSPRVQILMNESKPHQTDQNEISEHWAKRSYRLSVRALKKINTQIKAIFIQRFENENDIRLLGNIGHESTVLKAISLNSAP